MPEPTILVIFTTAFLIGFSGAMMPGSLLAYTISAAARYGFWAGPLLVLGHAILELTLISALILGLHQFLESDILSGYIGVIGGIVLVTMGFTMSFKGWKKSAISMSTSSNLVKNKRLVFSGIILSISNPYWFIWWVTVGMTYLLWSYKLGIKGVAFFFTGHILADLSWYALIAFIIASGRKAINQTIYSGLLVVCGVTIIGLGVYFVYSGITILID